MVVVRGDDPTASSSRRARSRRTAWRRMLWSGEIEPFPGGETCEGGFELEAGSYILFCNIVETEEDGTVESHFEEGMVTTVAAE